MRSDNAMLIWDYEGAKGGRGLTGPDFGEVEGRKDGRTQGGKEGGRGEEASGLPRGPMAQ